MGKQKDEIASAAGSRGAGSEQEDGRSTGSSGVRRHSERAGGGRANQRRRTREAILQAARDLIGSGAKPTILDVVEKARVSRATFYRYFPGEDALVMEAALAETVESTGVLLHGLDSAPVEERVSRVQEHFYDHAAGNERAFRAFLGALLSHSATSQTPPETPLRGGRRVPAIEEALAPVRGQVDSETFARLRTALAALVGVETLLIVKDVCGLPVDRGREVMNWAARRLVESVAGPSSRVRGRARARNPERESAR